MAIYIVRPKETTLVRPFSFDSIGLDPVSRRQQVEKIIQLNREEPYQRRLQEWLADAEEEHRLEVLRGPIEPSITGASILDLPEDEVERIQEELSELTIIRDQSIEITYPESLSVYPDSVKPQIPRYTRQIDKEHLWHLSEIGYDETRLFRDSQLGTDITVAVLDTGVDSSHEEFRNTSISAYEFNDEELDFTLKDYSRDTATHGTHVAGLICGSKIGVAKGASLLSCVVLPKGRGTLAGLIQAMERISMLPEVSIMNISAGLGVEREQGAMKEIVKYITGSGVILIAAAGNKGKNAIQSPAIYPEVISVGATDRKGAVANFSGGGIHDLEGYGRCEVPSLVAPGVDVFSSIPGEGYEAATGTSMATAIVSGMAASILGENLFLKQDELKEILCSKCKLLENQSHQGFGIAQIL